VSTIVNIIYI